MRPEMEPSQEFPGCLLDGRPESEALVPLVVAEERGQELMLDLLAGGGYPAGDKAHDIGIGIQAHQAGRVGHGEPAQHQSVRLKENPHSRSLRYCQRPNLNPGDQTRVCPGAAQAGRHHPRGAALPPEAGHATGPRAQNSPYEPVTVMANVGNIVLMPRFGPKPWSSSAC